MKRLISLVFTMAFLCAVLNHVLVYADDGVPEAVLSKTASVFYIEASSGRGGGAGTGFLVSSSSDGSYLLTNEHVIHINKDNVEVWIGENEKAQAKVVAASEQYDLAVLQVPELKGTALQLSSSIQQGDAIYAVGFPGDANYLSDAHAVTSAQATITNGVVSAIRSMKIVEYGPAVTILQINADINHGNSGGPLFDKKGNVVGVNTYGVVTASGINGAIGTESIVAFLKEANLYSQLNLTISNMPDGGSNAEITPLAKGDSYFEGKFLPAIWQFIVPAVLALGVAAFVIYWFMTKKQPRTAKAASEDISLSLDQYLNSISVPLSCEDICTLLIPVAKEMRDKHADGSLLMHLSPDSIGVNKQGCFIVPATGSAFVKPQFIAPEQIARGIASVKTDIYSFCRIMDYMYQSGRSAEKEETDEQDNQDNIVSQTHSEDTFLQIIAKGTADSPEERYSSMQDVLFDLASLNAGALSPTSSAPFAATAIVEAPKKIQKKWIIIIAGTTLALIAAVVVVNQLLVGIMLNKYAKENDPEKLCFWNCQSIFGQNEDYLEYSWAGYYLEKGEYAQAAGLFKNLDDFYNSETLYCESLYRQADALADQGQFDKAIEISNSLGDYKDSAEKVLNSNYRKAAALANSGDYDAAISIYNSIKGYKDSAEMVDNTTYRKGYSFLTAQKYDDAIHIFEKLKASGYASAEDALKEVYYTWGVELASKNDYYGAYQKLQNCSGYEDTSELVDALVPVIYEEGIEKYNKGGYSASEKFFKATSNYQRAKDYLFLIECHNSSWLGESRIKKLTNLIGFEDAGELIFKDSSAFYFLKGGTWRGSCGYITFYESGDNWWCTHGMNLPGGDWSFEDGAYRIKDKDVLYIVATSKNTIIIQYVSNGREYTMTRS